MRLSHAAHRGAHAPAQSGAACAAAAAACAAAAAAGQLRRAVLHAHEGKGAARPAAARSAPCVALRAAATRTSQAHRVPQRRRRWRWARQRNRRAAPAIPASGARCAAAPLLRPPRAVLTRRHRHPQYVADVQPGLLESFSNRAPPEVVDAMRQTIANMLGTLPPQVRRWGLCVFRSARCASCERWRRSGGGGKQARARLTVRPARCLHALTPRTRRCAQYFEVTINAVGENLAQVRAAPAKQAHRGLLPAGYCAPNARLSAAGFGRRQSADSAVSPCSCCTA